MLYLLVAMVGALIPTAVYVLFIYWLDRYEKEPLSLLGLAFLWGAFPAAFLSVLTEVAFDIPIAALGAETLTANLLSVSLSAPLVEESLKGIALIGLALVFQREFDDVLDGIIYGAMIGFGFAFTENFAAYFLPILSQEGIGAGAANIFLRTIVFGFNHAFWTGILGAAVGYARLSNDRRQRLVAPILGWMLAVALHSIHNTGATLVQQTSCLSLVVSFTVDWGGFFLLLAIAYLVLRKERGWLERGLVEEVRKGTLTPQEYLLLCSPGQRFWARWHAWGRGGWPAYHQVGRYFQCATELAFKKQHLRSLGDESGNLAEIHRLQEQLAAIRLQAWPWLWPPQP
ncbi:MAG: PrsW family intramembrane metalloprotease [Anaerolineae bacterium]|jgi:RsiW-degrading membrane proteinase PrsW (M82 family)